MNDTNPRYDFAKLEQENFHLRAALLAITQIQPEALSIIRKNGFVFEDIGVQPGNWQQIAFSMYSRLCEADQIARNAITP